MGWSTRLQDIVICDKYGQPAAVVEVKVGQDVSEEVARQVAVYLWEMDASPPPSVRYFLVLTPSRGYLWRVRGRPELWGQPLSFSMEGIVQRYGGLKDQPGLTHLSLAHLADRWLSDLTLGRNDESLEVLTPLQESGFPDAIIGGDVYLEENP